MTGLITLVVLVAVAVLTAVVFTITDDLVDRQIRAELEEAAGDIRARVLVFEDSFEPADEGPPPTNALLIDPEGDVAYGSVPVDQTAYADIAEITVSSAADAFSRDTVDGRTYETMTTAAFEDLGEALGVVVATYDATDDLADRDRRRRQVVGFAVVMVLGSAVAAWFVAGRSVRPAAAALAQQERFVADAAHELRTPVAAIRATVEAASVPHDETTARVARLAESASQLTDDPLTLARMDADRLELRREKVRLDLLAEVVADERDHVVVHSDEAVVVDADPGLIERVLSILVANAETHAEPSAERPVELVVLPGRVDVLDRGPGVPSGEQEQVFERFHSRAGSTGHGLGLALGRWIARAHGGDLTYADRDGGGAAFTLRLR